MIKKLIASMTLVGLLTAPAYALEVGDKMPDVGNTQLIALKEGVKNNKKIIFVHSHINGVCAYDGIYTFCNNKVTLTPFGVYDFKDKKFYLDNAPTDGVIDEVIENAGGRDAFEDAPGCI